MQMGRAMLRELGMKMGRVMGMEMEMEMEMVSGSCRVRHVAQA